MFSRIVLSFLNTWYHPRFFVGVKFLFLFLFFLVFCVLLFVFLVEWRRHWCVISTSLKFHDFFRISKHLFEGYIRCTIFKEKWIWVNVIFKLQDLHFMARTMNTFHRVLISLMFLSPLFYRFYCYKSESLS